MTWFAADVEERAFKWQHLPLAMDAPPGLEAENPTATAALRAQSDVGTSLASLAKSVNDSVVEMASDWHTVLSMLPYISNMTGPGEGLRLPEKALTDPLQESKGASQSLAACAPEAACRQSMLAWLQADLGTESQGVSAGAAACSGFTCCQLRKDPHEARWLSSDFLSTEGGFSAFGARVSGGLTFQGAIDAGLLCCKSRQAAILRWYLVAVCLVTDFLVSREGELSNKTIPSEGSPQELIVSDSTPTMLSTQSTLSTFSKSTHSSCDHGDVEFLEPEEQPWQGNGSRKKQKKRNGAAFVCEYSLIPRQEILEAFEFVPKLYGRSTADRANVSLHSFHEMLGTYPCTGKNMKDIAASCGGKVRLRGRGSRYYELGGLE
ncbi:unnamed protein product, partial [Symbiodinium necroappetens]